MPSESRSRIAILETALRPLVGSRSIDAWIDASVRELLELTGQIRPPVALEPMLHLRRIRLEQSDIERETASLVPTADGFRLRLGAFRSPSQSRLVLAHEVAHSLLYDLRSTTPQLIAGLPWRHGALEWLCDRVARTLLAPSDWLRESIGGPGQLNAPPLLLARLERLRRVYELPRWALAQRLVEDMRGWSCTVLQFERHLREEAGDRMAAVDWRLQWHVKPGAGCGKLFIPSGSSRGREPAKKPRAKGEFADFLDATWLSPARWHAEHVAVTILRASCLGNLASYVVADPGDSTRYFAMTSTMRPVQLGHGEQAVGYAVLVFPVSADGREAELGRSAQSAE